MKRKTIFASVIGVLGGMVMAWAIQAQAVQNQAPRVHTPVASTATSPLERYLGFGYHPVTEDKILDEEFAKTELIIARCMREKGFEYTPLANFDDKGSGAANEAYESGLSESQQAAYNVALFGDLVDAQDSEGITADKMQTYDTDKDGEIDYVEGFALGCNGRADRELKGSIFEAHDRLRDELDQVNEAIANHPSDAKSTARWIECANAAGFAGDTEGAVGDTMADSILNGTVTPEQAAAKVEPCDEARRQALVQIRVEKETEFFEANRELIEKVGVLAPPDAP